jgi:hypothetical protein
MAHEDDYQNAEIAKLRGDVACLMNVMACLLDALKIAHRDRPTPSGGPRRSWPLRSAGS